MSFEEKVWEHYQGNGLDEAVEKLLREYDIAATYWDELRPVFHNEVRRVVRESARGAEHKINEQRGHFRLGPRGKRPTAVARIDLKGRQPIEIDFEKLLSKSVSLGDGRYKRWRDLTVEEHRERIAMLQKNVTGLNETISLHEWSIEQIIANRKKTLGDLAPVA